jgi:hypothetical protein
VGEVPRKNSIESRECPRSHRRTVIVRMIGGPANGKVVEVDISAERTEWSTVPPIQWDAFESEPDVSFSGETHVYGRKDFAYRLVSGKTRYWRIMVHEPNKDELMRDIDDLVCKAFDTFFGSSIRES